MRIYADESGTHGHDWLVIGMLFLPNHASLHRDLCRIKEDAGYLNRQPRRTRNARYKETHFSAFRAWKDAEIAERWIDRFLASQSVFRSIVVDWSIFQPKYFGKVFDPDALKKRRAYKKWAEMLLQPEISRIRNAVFYLDRLRILHGYDVLDHLQYHFSHDGLGRKRKKPRILEFKAAQSWKDANQCLQLCDLLVGCVYQSLNPSTNKAKLRVTDYLYDKLRDYGVRDRSPGFWKQFAEARVSDHFPKFSEWFWKPKEKKGMRKKKT